MEILFWYWRCWVLILLWSIYFQLLENHIKNEIIEKSELVHALPEGDEKKITFSEPRKSASIACGATVFEICMKVPTWASQVFQLQNSPSSIPCSPLVIVILYWIFPLFSSYIFWAIVMIFFVRVVLFLEHDPDTNLMPDSLNINFQCRTVSSLSLGFTLKVKA